MIGIIKVLLIGLQYLHDFLESMDDEIQRM